METIVNNKVQFDWSEICTLYPDSWVLTGIATEETQKDWKTRKYVVLYQHTDKETFDIHSLQTIQACRAQKLYAGYFDSYTGVSKQPTKKTGLLKKVMPNE
jgi:hypothetical protein